jgi:hypothetical protein
MSFLVTACVVAVLVLVAVRDRSTHGRESIFDIASDGLFLAACTLALLHAIRIELVGLPLAEESLAAVGDSVTLPAVGQPVSVLVGGTLLNSGTATPNTAHYRLAIRDGQHTLALHDGTFAESWNRVGRGRRGRMAVHTIVEEERIDLPVETTGRGLTLTLSKLDGELDGPVRVGLVPAPWSPVSVALAGALVLVAGAVLEAKRAAGSKRTVCLAVLALFSVCLTRLVTPDGPWQMVGGAALVASLGGLPLGLLVARLSRRLVRRRRPVSVAS